MTAPIDPVRRPLVEPATPARAVARRHEEPHEDESRRRREEQEQDRRQDGTEEPDGLHVDVLA